MAPAGQGSTEGERRRRRGWRPLAAVNDCHRILEAMTRVVAEDGYGAASPEKVAARAGVPESAFREHFESVEDCFLATYDAGVERAARVIAKAVRAAGRRGKQVSWGELVEAGFAAVLDFLAGEPAFARLGVVEVLWAGPRALERREGALRRAVTVLDELRRAHGEAVPRLATDIIVRGTHEAIYARVIRGETERLPALLPDLRYCWLVPFVGRYEAAAARDETAEPWR